MVLRRLSADAAAWGFPREFTQRVFVPRGRRRCGRRAGRSAVWTTCIARSFRDSVWRRACCAGSSPRGTGWRRYRRGRCVGCAVGVSGVSEEIFAWMARRRGRRVRARAACWSWRMKRMRSRRAGRAISRSKGSLLVACESVFLPVARVVARVRVNDLVEVGLCDDSQAETPHEGTHRHALRRRKRRRRHRQAPPRAHRRRRGRRGR